LRHFWRLNLILQVSLPAGQALPLRGHSPPTTPADTGHVPGEELARLRLGTLGQTVAAPVAGSGTATALGGGAIANRGNRVGQDRGALAQVDDVPVVPRLILLDHHLRQADLPPALLLRLREHYGEWNARQSRVARQSIN